MAVASEANLLHVHEHSCAQLTLIVLNHFFLMTLQHSVEPFPAGVVKQLVKFLNKHQFKCFDTSIKLSIFLQAALKMSVVL